MRYHTGYLVSWRREALSHAEALATQKCIHLGLNPISLKLRFTIRLPRRGQNRVRDLSEPDIAVGAVRRRRPSSRGPAFSGVEGDDADRLAVLAFH